MSTLIRQIFYQPVGEVDVGGADFGGGVWGLCFGGVWSQ